MEGWTPARAVAWAETGADAAADPHALLDLVPGAPSGVAVLAHLVDAEPEAGASSVLDALRGFNVALAEARACLRGQPGLRAGTARDVLRVAQLYVEEALVPGVASVPWVAAFLAERFFGVGAGPR